MLEYILKIKNTIQSKRHDYNTLWVSQNLNFFLVPLAMADVNALWCMRMQVEMHTEIQMEVYIHGHGHEHGDAIAGKFCSQIV